MYKVISHCLLVLSIAFGVSSARAEAVRVSKLSDSESFTQYVKELIKLIAEKTPEGGPIDLKPSTIEMSQDRALASLRENKEIDLFWTMTSKEREAGLRVIRIPILKGLLGNRIFIINKGDQAKFDKVQTMDDLKKLSFGQGHDWPDTFILEAGGLKVEKSPNYQGLFPMLAAKRFDAFPRGVNEPWTEITGDNAKFNLEIEKKLCVSYFAPLFFFVNANNKALGDRIEKGFNLAIKDGSFDKLFNQYWGDYLTKADMKNRKIFKIDNPHMSPETKKALEENPQYLLKF